MEVVKALPFIVFFSYSKCESLQTSLLHAARQRLNGQDYLEENLGISVSIMVAQFLQDATYEEVQTIAKELLNLAEKCKRLKPHESPSECAHQLMATFLTHICNNQGLVASHVFPDCCKMKTAARLRCFLSYKKDDADGHDTPLILRSELTCEAAVENNVSPKARFSYEISRRHPFLYGPTILTMSACYETAVQSCCQEENKTECLRTKLEPIRKYIRGISARHHHLCEIGTKFNEKVASAVFLYEYSRRHLELAVPVTLRVFETYKRVLEKCCKLENPLECHQPGKEVFQRVVLESRDRVKTYCDLQKQLGSSSFQDRLTVLYTKKAPQLSAQELVVLVKKMAAVARRCCPLRDELQSACVEDQAKLVLGELCRSHSGKPVNAGVGHCCDDSYAFRKPCFDDLQVDGTYISPPLSCDQAISLKEVLCQAQDEELQLEKQKLLSTLVKQKPRTAEDLFLSIGEDFVQLVEKCCRAQRRDVCFQEEGPQLITRCQSLLEASSSQSGLM
ncbi:alpha-fetoprotein-like isoform X6 [Mus pahari]|uniref:alpha-fetoprotein-like isoform X6 n=1 Tax=Mus pahari TaxID=10093 RepID=UPI001114A5A0|nr:alpha-fetoprotein-like isoform X6 [Mus pahari]